jgi:hypothetical protein
MTASAVDFNDKSVPTARARSRMLRKTCDAAPRHLGKVLAEQEALERGHKGRGVRR